MTNNRYSYTDQIEEEIQKLLSDLPAIEIPEDVRERIRSNVLTQIKEMRKEKEKENEEQTS